MVASILLLAGLAGAMAGTRKKKDEILLDLSPKKGDDKPLSLWPQEPEDIDDPFAFKSIDLSFLNTKIEKTTLSFSQLFSKPLLPTFDDDSKAEEDRRRQEEWEAEQEKQRLDEEWEAEQEKQRLDEEEQRRREDEEEERPQTFLENLLRPYIRHRCHGIGDC
jgi:hypothetical protein